MTVSRATRLPKARIPARHLRSLPARPLRKSSTGAAPRITRASRARFAKIQPDVGLIRVSSKILDHFTTRLAGNDDIIEIQVFLRQDFRPIGIITYEVKDEEDRVLISGEGDGQATLARNFSAAGPICCCYTLSLYRTERAGLKTLLGLYEIHVGRSGLQHVFKLQENVKT